MLPFTRDEFFTVFASYNTAVWPAQLFLYALALAMVAWAARRRPLTDRWIPFGLAALWLWTGVLYHWREFTAVNRMAWLFGALFVLQGVLFAVAAARGGRLQVGRPAREVPFLGVPCPTTIFTFGLLFWAAAPVPRHLLVIPLLWAFFGSSAVVLLGVVQDVGLLVAGLLGLLLLLRWPTPRRPAAQSPSTCQVPSREQASDGRHRSIVSRVTLPPNMWGDHPCPGVVEFPRSVHRFSTLSGRSVMRQLVVVVGLVAVSLGLFAQPAAAGSPAPDRSGRVEVMTRNVYVGADIFRVFDATTPAEVPLVVAGILQTVFDTDFVARSQALADEIARHRPHLIGLQEVSLLRVQSPGDFLIGNPQPAETELFDYLDILLARLAERGLDYRVAAVVENADVELPFLAAIVGGVPQLDDIRLTDRDVILARGDVDTSDALARNYAVNFSVPFGVFTIDFLRGFTAVDATVHDRDLRFVNTHLEVQGIVPGIQQAQTAELLSELAAEELPVVLVGDFNSAPEDPFPAPYAQLAAAGYTDTWLHRLGRPEDGATCCFTETLDDPDATLSSRIDLVWARTDATAPPFEAGIGPVRATVVGDELRDRTDGGLWPSDHAGVVTSMVLRLPR